MSGQTLSRTDLLKHYHLLIDHAIISSKAPVDRDHFKELVERWEEQFSEENIGDVAILLLTLVCAHGEAIQNALGKPI